MGLLRRKKRESVLPEPGSAGLPATSAESNIDWTDINNIRAEWANQLQSPDQGMLGWQNGMMLYDDGPIPAQRLNVAEYMTRALAHSLFEEPLLTDDQAAEAVRRVLTMIEGMWDGALDWQMEFGPRIARLALAVTRLQGWQPIDLGGDGRVTEEIMSADPEGLVWMSVRCPGVRNPDTMINFFRSST